MSSEDQNWIAGQTLRGSLYSLGSSVVTISLGMLRAILLARLLAPADFGVVALALFFVTLAAQIRALGLEQAYISRQNADAALRRTFVTLQTALSGVSALLLIGLAPLIAAFYPTMTDLGAILAVLAAPEIVRGLGLVQEAELSKQLAFRQLAITNMVASIVMTIVAPGLAWAGWGVWALVAEVVSGLLARVLMLGLFFRFWPARPGWNREAAHWFWSYGRAAWGAGGLQFLLDRFDDFWVGTALGQSALGYYSRAYEFARYPRRVIATPLTSVFQPVFARLQDDRRRLSQALYRAAYVIVRGGFLAAGAFALIMPEFIALIIGEQWAPMLLTFRLMLVYTMLDGLIVLGANFLFAVGKPQQYQFVTMVQFAFFVPAVIVTAALGGIEGVALAANAMLLLGGILLYRYLRRLADFSVLRLLAWPTLALLLAWSAGLSLEWHWPGMANRTTALAKLALFGTIYALVLLLFEGRESRRGLAWLWAALRGSGQMTP